jgi:DUF1680 family protein
MWQEIPCVRHCGAKAAVFDNGYVMFFAPGAKEAYREGYTFKSEIPKRPWFCETCNAIAKTEAEMAKLAGPVRRKNESARDYRERVKRWREN